MLIYIIAILEALAYLSAVPVCAAFLLRSGDGEGSMDGLKLGVGLSAFSPRAAQARAARGLRRVRLQKPSPGVDPLRLWRATTNLRVDAFSLRGHLSLGDAAVTAMACGALTALAWTLRARADAAQVELAPVFDSSRTRIELKGMIRARSGQIILAAARGELTSAKGRIAQWTSTRLRASWPPPWRTSAT